MIGFVRKSAASSTPAMCFTFHTSCCTASCNALERSLRCLDLHGPFGLSTTWIPDWESPYNTLVPFSVNLPSSKRSTRTATESPRLIASTYEVTSDSELLSVAKLCRLLSHWIKPPAQTARRPWWDLSPPGPNDASEWTSNVLASLQNAKFPSGPRSAS